MMFLITISHFAPFVNKGRETFWKKVSLPDPTLKNFFGGRGFYVFVCVLTPTYSFSTRLQIATATGIVNIESSVDIPTVFDA